MHILLGDNDHESASTYIILCLFGVPVKVYSVKLSYPVASDIHRGASVITFRRCRTDAATLCMDTD